MAIAATNTDASTAGANVTPGYLIPFDVSMGTVSSIFLRQIEDFPLEYGDSDTAMLGAALLPNDAGFSITGSSYLTFAPAAAVPEPSSVIVLGIGAMLLGGARFRRRGKQLALSDD